MSLNYQIDILSIFFQNFDDHISEQDFGLRTCMATWCILNGLRRIYTECIQLYMADHWVSTQDESQGRKALG